MHINYLRPPYYKTPSPPAPSPEPEKKETAEAAPCIL